MEETDEEEPILTGNTIQDEFSIKEYKNESLVSSSDDEEQSLIYFEIEIEILKK